MFFTILAAGVLLFLGRNLCRLVKNYRTARQIGLPIVICPVTWQNPLWILFTIVVDAQKLARIPGLGWVRYTYLGWVLHDTYHAHAKYGPAFIVVSSGKNEIFIGEYGAISEVMSKYKRWRRPREMYKIFTAFGENVDTVEGEDWQRHRKIISAGFTEPHNEIVWDTTVKQTSQWLEREAESQEINFNQLNSATNTISANVLMKTGFGKDYAFHDKGLKDVKLGNKKSLYEAMHYMLINLLSIWVLKDVKLPAWLQPKMIREIHETVAELRGYFSDILSTRSGDFVQALLEANESEKAGGRGYLSQEELYGNMYILQLAGFDTTSYSMCQTLALLSAYSEVQEWVREEVITSTNDTSDRKSNPPTTPGSFYKSQFASSIRVQAAMLETLRLHTAAPNLERISQNPETLKIGGKVYAIPPNTLIASNFPNLHNDPKIWGQDSREWKPQRWVEVGEDGLETLKHRSELMAWSAGPRVCPGRKFSQVETVAALTTVLNDYRLEGSSNVHEILRDFKFELTPKPLRPEELKIKVVKI